MSPRAKSVDIKKDGKELVKSRRAQSPSISPNIHQFNQVIGSIQSWIRSLLIPTSQIEEFEVDLDDISSTGLSILNSKKKSIDPFLEKWKAFQSNIIGCIETDPDEMLKAYIESQIAIIESKIAIPKCSSPSKSWQKSNILINSILGQLKSDFEIFNPKCIIQDCESLIETLKGKHSNYFSTPEINISERSSLITSITSICQRIIYSIRVPHPVNLKVLDIANQKFNSFFRPIQLSPRSRDPIIFRTIELDPIPEGIDPRIGEAMQKKQLFKEKLRREKELIAETKRKADQYEQEFKQLQATLESSRMTKAEATFLSKEDAISKQIDDFQRERDLLQARLSLIDERMEKSKDLQRKLDSLQPINDVCAILKQLDEGKVTDLLPVPSSLDKFDQELSSKFTAGLRSKVSLLESQTKTKPNPVVNVFLTSETQRMKDLISQIPKVGNRASSILPEKEELPERSFDPVPRLLDEQHKIRVLYQSTGDEKLKAEYGELEARLAPVGERCSSYENIHAMELQLVEMRELFMKLLEDGNVVQSAFIERSARVERLQADVELMRRNGGGAPSAEQIEELAAAYIERDKLNATRERTSSLLVMNFPFLSLQASLSENIETLKKKIGHRPSL